MFGSAVEIGEIGEIGENETGHIDQDGGEQHVDLIHYRHDRVVYIETTVANYCDKKIPLENGNEREEAIINSIQKCLGADTFAVELEKGPSSYLGSSPSPKKLVATYKKRSNKPRPDPPELMHIVATTCPRSVKLSQQRTKKASWIRMCFLEDLVASKIIPVEYQQRIMEAQAKNAGRP